MERVPACDVNVIRLDLDPGRGSEGQVAPTNYANIGNAGEDADFNFSSAGLLASSYFPYADRGAQGPPLPLGLQWPSCWWLG